MSDSVKIGDQTFLTSKEVEVVVSGPKTKDRGGYAIGHVAISIGGQVFEVGRYAGTYKRQWRDAAPEAIRDQAGQAGWAFGPAILIKRSRKTYLREEKRSRNLRGYVMQAEPKHVQKILEYVKTQTESAKSIHTLVKTGGSDYTYLRSVLRKDPAAKFYELPSSYKLVGNSCVDFVAEALDDAYWIWDFDNVWNMDPSDLSKKLELNSKYTKRINTYRYVGGKKNPGWWFEVKTDGKSVLSDGPSKTPSAGQIYEDLKSSVFE